MSGIFLMSALIHFNLKALAACPHQHAYLLIAPLVTPGRGRIKPEASGS